MATLKVLAIISEDVGGAEVYIRSMKHQLGREIELEIQAWPAFKYSSVFRTFSAWVRLAWISPKGHYLINVATFFDILKIFFLYSKAKKISAVVHLNKSWSFARFRSARWVFHRAMDLIDNIFLVSDFQRELVNSDQAVVIGSFLNHNLFSSNFSCIDRPVDIAYVGRLTEQKGADDLLRFIEANPSLRFLIVGSGDRNYEERLNALDRERENIEFRGYVAQEEIVEIYAQAKLVFQPSYLDTRSLQTQEAILCGCEVLLYDVPGARELAQEYSLECTMPGELPQIESAVAALTTAFADQASREKRLARREKLCIALNDAQRRVVSSLSE